jgi:presenilin-like A22 family membrane protease
MGTSWVAWPSWVTIDLAGVLITALVLVVVSQVSIRLLSLAAVGFVSYDVLNVFVTGFMQKAAAKALPVTTTVNEATGDVAVRIMPRLPSLIVIPNSWGWSADAALFLGLGDVILPGMLIIAGARLAVAHGDRRFWVGPFGGYALGMIVANVTVVVSRSPQPATLYLVPAVIGGLLWAGRRHGLSPRRVLHFA